MADQITQDENGRTYRNGVLQVHSTPPGGAIQNMIAALVSAFKPVAPGASQLSGRGRQIDQAVDEASGAPQTSDLGQQF